MSDPRFVDTNILVYAFAETGDKRHIRARALVEELLNAQQAVVSVQVLREFYSVATRKVKRRMPVRDVAALIRDLCFACRVVDDTVPHLERALELTVAHDLSIWDASIVAAAEAAACVELCTEDLTDGAIVGKVRVRNPLI